MLSTLVLSPLILIPHRVQALSRASIICCSSFLFSATRVRSSAYRAFWMQVVNGVLSLYDRNSPPLVVYSTCRPPLVISMASLTILSMKQLNRRGDSTHPCLTPVFTSKSSDVPSAVLTQHHVPVYSSLMMSSLCSGPLTLIEECNRYADCWATLTEDYFTVSLSSGPLTLIYEASCLLPLALPACS